MKNIKGDIWKQKADAICITTNGVVSSKNRAVMGKGIALQAKIKVPGIDFVLAQKLKKYGNHVYLLTEEVKDQIQIIDTPFKKCKNLPYHMISFPTKNDWKHISSMKLIQASAKRLMELIKQKDWDKVIVPRPGRANGQLEWKNVKPILKEIFDNKVYVIRKD